MHRAPKCNREGFKMKNQTITPVALMHEFVRRLKVNLEAEGKTYGGFCKAIKDTRTRKVFVRIGNE